MKDWESYARQFHTARERGPDFVKTTMERLAETAELAPTELPGGPWVDVGAGTGRLSGGLADFWNRDVVALEPQPEMIAARETHPRVRWVRATAVEPPLSSGQAAGVFLHLVLHQVDAWKTALDRLSRLLGRGGLLAIRTTNPERVGEGGDSNLFPRLETLVKRRLVSTQTLTRTLEQLGLTVWTREYESTRRIPRDEYIGSIENKMLSTFRELTDDEFQEGFGRLLVKYPATIGYVEQTMHSLFVVGRLQ